MTVVVRNYHSNPTNEIPEDLSVRGESVNVEPPIYEDTVTVHLRIVWIQAMKWVKIMHTTLSNFKLYGLVNTSYTCNTNSLKPVSSVQINNTIDNINI